MTEERKGVLFVFVAAVLYSLGGLCIKLIPDWSGLALNAGRNGIALVVYAIFFAATRHKPRFNRGGLLRVYHERAVCCGQQNDHGG